MKQLITTLTTKVKNLLNKVRSLKQKLSHDNLFDIALGAILALIGLYLYLYIVDMDKLIIIALPLLVSWVTELINKLQGAKFGRIDLFYRFLIPVLLFLLI